MCGMPTDAMAAGRNAQPRSWARNPFTSWQTNAGPVKQQAGKQPTGTVNRYQLWNGADQPSKALSGSDVQQRKENLPRVVLGV